MTSTEEKSAASSSESEKKKNAFDIMAQFGEFFTDVFIKIIKFIGICGLYIAADICRVFGFIKEPLKAFFTKIGKSLSVPFKRYHKANKLAKAEISRNREEKGALGAATARTKIVGRSIFGKRGLLATAVNWGLPIVCCVFLFNLVSYANNQNYALKLTVNGDFIGYINDENTFKDAEKIVQNRINYVGNTTKVISFEPSYEVDNIGTGNLLNKYQVANSMLLLLGKDVKEGYGLYLGETYYGTLTSHAKLDKALNDILDKYKTDNENETVRFDRDISYIGGTYLTDSFVNEDDIIKQFTSNKKVETFYTIETGDYFNKVLEKTGMTAEELAELNPGFDEDYPLYGGQTLKTSADEPFLTVMVTREEQYTESFDFDTEYVDDSTVYVGNKTIRTPGENGERSIVANVSYINGVEVSRRIVSRTVTKEPVTQVEALGTKPRKNDTAPGQTIEAGKMLWPVGGYDGGTIWWFVWWKGGYSTHKGIDIGAPAGTPIYAAENGVVTEAAYSGYNGGCGSYVAILGDSGYTTLYYHQSEVVAYVGQRVTAGDLIGYVGQTGWAEGNHLHFGVRVGSTYLDPMDFLPYHQMNERCQALYPVYY